MKPSLVLRIAGRQLVELIIGIPIAILFWPCLLYLWGVLKIIRFGVQSFLNYSHKSSNTNESDRQHITEYELAAGSDSIFGYKVKNSCNSVIPGFCVINGKFDHDLIIRRVHQMVDANPKLRMRFGKKLGFFCWEKNDGSFNINNHVRVLTTEVVDESKLMEILESLSIKEVNSDFPMWELLLIPSYRLADEDPNKKTQHYAQILRVHHSYGDGISFCLTSNAYLFDTPAQLPLDPKKGFPVPAWALLIQYIKVVLLGPLYFLCHLINFNIDESKFSIMDEYSTTKYMSRSSTPLKLSMLKDIKTRSKVSVTAILINAICSSLRNTHKKLYPGEKIPKILNTANVNAMLPYKDDQIQNRFTIFPFAAPFALVNDDENEDALNVNIGDGNVKAMKQRMEQLEKTHEEGCRVTMSPDPIFCYFMIKVVGDLPSFIQDILLGLSGTPCMLSNIPGIVDTVKVFNGQVIDSGAWLPLIRVTGIAVATYTYRGELKFCGIADGKAFPDRSVLQYFLNNIVDEVHALYEDQEKQVGVVRGREKKQHEQQQQQREDDNKEKKLKTQPGLLHEITNSYRRYLRSKQA